jgi:gluconokinase
MTPARAARVVVGLDVGTTGVKAAAFGIGRPWRRVAIREYPLMHPGPDEEVEDPDVILAATADALAECVSNLGGAAVVAVSVSAAMHGLLALDGDLRPLTPLITWADARAVGEAERLHRDGLAGALHSSTGTPVHPMTPLVKLMWFSSEDRDTWSAARWWIGLKEWILLGLTGRLVAELSSASGTGLLDMTSGGWAAPALDVCRIDPDRLPPLVPSTTVLSLAPAMAERVGLPPDTPVVAGAGDGPLGNLGVGAISPGVAGLSVGTSGAVRMTVPSPGVDSGHTLFCYGLTDGLWVLGAATSNGGSVLRWAGSALAPDVWAAPGDQSADEKILEMAATVPAGSEGLVMLPYLLAERGPLWDPDIPGAYLGLRRHHSRAHLVRAALEGVCLQVRLIVDRLEEVYPVQEVRATGGVFRSPLWQQTVAAMLARPIHVVGDAEGTALGAAALGLFAVGQASTLTEAVAALSGEGQVLTDSVEPDPGLVQTYGRLREHIPTLIEGVTKVSRVLEGTSAAAVKGSPGPPPADPRGGGAATGAGRDRR